MPTPPEAMTGMGTRSATARVSSRSKPSRVPSRSMLVSRISPAPSSRHALAPGHGVDARRPAPAVGEHLPARRRRRAGLAARVDRDDDRLGAERVGGAAHQLGIGDRGGVDADLVGAGQQQLAHVLDRAHAAADGERQEHRSAVARTTSSMVARPSDEAEMSRKQISSAPCAS